jgi:hypothetical protein
MIPNQLDDGDWNAINFGLKHICGFRDDPLSMRIGATASNGSEKPNTMRGLNCPAVKASQSQGCRGVGGETP